MDGSTTILWWIFCGILGGAIGATKGRGAAGLIWGLLLGPIGILITLCLSNEKKKMEEAELRWRIAQSQQSERFSSPQHQLPAAQKSASSAGGWLVVLLVFAIGGAVLWFIFRDTDSSDAPHQNNIVASATPVPPSTDNSATPISEPIAQGSFSTVQEAQREAVRRYPALGVAGSALNTMFVARYKLYQQQRPEYFRDPSWPIRLAEELNSTPQSK